ncbi:MAG: Rrf2 family transcriptional regulator [Lachnospiraceae bacterium]|nr:Rrf2 family transcriptional regulator [Lachnospiraceae bacterium]
MQISSRFTIAVQVFACISTFAEEHKITSDFLASSVNANPVVIRRILQQLKGAGLIQVTRGSGGAAIAKPVETITLLDIFKAVECVDGDQLFHFHENPNAQCPVGRNIHNVLDGRLENIQKVMENEMSKVTVADIIRDTSKYIENENR